MQPRKMVGSFGFKQKRDCTICVAKTKAMISCAMILKFLHKPSVKCFVSVFQLQTWVTQIVLARLSQHSNMGTTLQEGQDFLEIHEHLEEDISVST